MVNRGFTLVEVLVALVILEVGLLGVAGSLFVASRTVARASLLERATGALEQVVDSLSRHGTPGTAHRDAPGGVVSWTVGARGEIAATFVGEDGTVVGTLAGLVAP